jgi:uroporphyrinogen-III synthase
LNILLTKQLPQPNIELIKSFGWDFDIVNALEISLVNVEQLPSNQADAWIVSSRNSLAVVQKFIAEAPAKIYCIGNWMAKELGKIFEPSRIMSFKKMSDLVGKLQKQSNQHFLYFCADNHREELEEGMQGTLSVITKIITHESRLTHPILKKDYDVVFVFSPRSAESLLKNNTFSPKTIFACIGSTTVSYLKEQGMANTFCASYPESEILLNELRTWVLKKDD